MNGVRRFLSWPWYSAIWANVATGVCFSRDAATGENLFNGEYLVNAKVRTLWPESVHPDKSR